MTTKMRRRHKKMLVRGIFLLLLFMAAVAGLFFMPRNIEVKEMVITERESASLPVIEVQVDNQYINLMHGYVNEMVGRYMRDTLTPLPKNRKLQIRITEEEDKVTAIRYKIRSMDNVQLVENTEVEQDSWKREELSESESQITVKLPIQNLLEEGQEYQLQIMLETEKHKEVVYYTRIVQSDALAHKEMMQFIRRFHDNTLEPKSEFGMASYMKQTTDNSGSLGKVTLNSTYSQVLWNHLNPKQRGDCRIYLTDINNSIGTFRMESKVSFKGENKINHSCNVEEVFTVQVSNGYWYVLNYERKVNEELTAASMEEGRIRLGIVEDDSLHVMNSENGTSQAFVMDGALWMNHCSEGEGNALTQVFSYSEETADVRADYKEHDIKLVSVDDEGNVSFIVYGYINSGEHEGEVGLEFFSYNAEKNCLQEIFYLPFDSSYAILKEEVGQLAYVNASELFYLMLNGKIYAIDFAGKEYMTVVENISNDALVINSDSNVIAWEEDRKSAGASQIQILYLDDGHQNTVKVEKNSGEYLKAIGFIGEDLVVGKITKDDYKKFNKVTETPMYGLDIIDTEGKVAASYRKNKILITDTSLENGSVLLKRSKIKKNKLTPTSDDALIENINQTSAEEELLITRKAEEGYRDWYLIIPEGSSSPDVKLVTGISVSDSSYLKISLNQIVEDGRFFAYSKGRLQGIYTSAADALNQVYDDVGCVTDSNGGYVMRRGYRNYSILDVKGTKTGSSKEDRRNACMLAFSAYEGGSYTETFAEMKSEGLTDAQMLQKGMNTKVYDLTGCSLGRIVYFYLGHKHPIYGMTSKGAVLVTGVGGEKVSIWNPGTGTTDSMNISEAEAMFAEAGNIFISCMK